MRPSKVEADHVLIVSDYVIEKLVAVRYNRIDFMDVRDVAL